MKIRILGVDDPLILKEFAVINQSFFDEWEWDDEDSDWDLKVIFQYFKWFENQLSVMGFFYIKGNPHGQSIGINRESVRKGHDWEKREAIIHKSICLELYYSLLALKTGLHVPWGLLNGMRPTKLVHSEKKRDTKDEVIRKAFREKYFVSAEKLDLLFNVANHQLKVVPDLYNLEKEVSIYIGIPFCPTRCAYCTFAAYAYERNKKWIEPFLNALLAEIEWVGRYLKQQNIPVTSIYLGGGTPTMLDVGQLREVLKVLYSEIANDIEVREITVEAGRPDTITLEKLELLKEFRINRISINPQSFNQTTLDAIGRHHSVNDVVEKFKMAKQVGIKNVNMDLIVGLPGEGIEELAHNLAQIKDLQPESLTIHMLALKRKSEIHHERELYTVASKDVLTEMARMTYEFAKREGYVPYYLYRQKNIAGNMENIGYAKAHHESIYNVLMMEEAQNVLGLGLGASSKFLIGESVHNPKDLRTYIENYEHYVKKKLELLELSMKIKAQAFTYNPPIEEQNLPEL